MTNFWIPMALSARNRYVYVHMMHEQTHITYDAWTCMLTIYVRIYMYMCIFLAHSCTCTSLSLTSSRSRFVALSFVSLPLFPPHSPLTSIRTHCRVPCCWVHEHMLSIRTHCRIPCCYIPRGYDIYPIHRWVSFAWYIYIYISIPHTVRFLLQTKIKSWGNKSFTQVWKVQRDMRDMLQYITRAWLSCQKCERVMYHVCVWYDSHVIRVNEYIMCVRHDSGMCVRDSSEGNSCTIDTYVQSMSDVVCVCARAYVCARVCVRVCMCACVCVQAVSGKQFVIALRKLIGDFGNVDDKFLGRIDLIAQESEAVSLLQCIAVRCSVLQCVAMFSRGWIDFIAQESEAVICFSSLFGFVCCANMIVVQCVVLCCSKSHRL